MDANMLPLTSHKKLEDRLRYGQTEGVDVVQQVGNNTGSNTNLGTQKVGKMFVINNRPVKEEQHLVGNDIAWLSTSNPADIHRKALENRVEGTGSWLLDSEKFRQWKDTPGDFLWLHGRAGCGKTLLWYCAFLPRWLAAVLTTESAGIIQHLEKQNERNAPDYSTAVAYYYFSFKEPRRTDQDIETAPVENLLRSLIKQLCKNLPKLPHAVHHLHSKVEYRKSNMIDLGTLRNTLLDLAKELGSTYIIIDALDELGAAFPESDPLYDGKLSKARSKMVDLLKSLTKCDAIHLLVTSKDGASWDIIDKSLATLAKKPGNHDVTVEGDGLDGDIDKMIDEELSKPDWEAFRNDDPELLDLIKRKSQHSNGMFRLAKCRLEVLYKVFDRDQAPDSTQVKAALEDLPDEIYELYDNAVNQISSIGNAMMVLQWLMCAVRPLKVSELTELMNWSQKAKTHYRSIRRTFGSLISVSSEADGGDAEVELAHFTVREYLSERAPDRRRKDGEFEAHLTVAHHCLKYLSYCASEEERHGTEVSECSLRRRPLLEYAINNWYRHALQCLEQTRLTDAVREILPDNGEKISSKMTWNHASKAGMMPQMGDFASTLLTRLYDGCRMFLTSIFTARQPLPKLATTRDDNKKWHHGNTSTAAVVSGRFSTQRAFSNWTESTKSLLESSHMDLNDYRRAVKQAAYRGYEFAVDLLLEHGARASAHSPNYDALTAASTDRYHLMMMLLLDGDVGDAYGDNWWPEESASDVITDGTSIVRSLLMAGADVTVVNSMGETALHQAAAKGNDAVARLLLSRGAKTELQCSGNGIVIYIRDDGFSWRWKCRGTPLHWAVTKGHHAMARLLLNECADIAATVNETGQTALHLAARDADEAMAQLLLDKNSDIEAKDNSGASALVTASGHGRLDVVQCLLKNGADVHVCTPDGRTPLQAAAFAGHRAVVTMLLEQGVDVNAAGEDGFTALHVAAQEGHEEVIQILLHKGANVDSTGIHDFTPLLSAAWKGHEKCIRKLLSHGAKVNAERDSGQTALSLAAEKGHIEVSTLLLKAGAEISIRMTIWGTILNAAAYGANDVVFRACREGGMDHEERDAQGRTLIHFASAGGKSDMISKVLGMGLAASTRDKQGRNALHFAASSNSSSAVGKILAQPDIDPHLADNDGWTALHWAARRDDLSVIKMLLEAGVVGEENEEWPPARIAAFHGNTHLLPTLLGHKSTAPDTLAEDTQSSEPKGYNHDNIRCDGCFLDLIGTRFRCYECQVIDYCFKCMWSSAKTHPGHRFERFRGNEVVQYDAGRIAASRKTR